MAYTLVESYLYACTKVGHARNRSRTANTACFNEGFLKQAILGSKKLAEKPVDSGRRYNVYGVDLAYTTTTFASHPSMVGRMV